MTSRTAGSPISGTTRPISGNVAAASARSINSLRKCAGASGVIFGGEGDDGLQIVQRPGRENYFEAHAWTSWRASSAGIPSRRRACSRAVWMPASSLISRAISASGVSSGSLFTSSMTVSRLLMSLLSVVTSPKTSRGKRGPAEGRILALPLGARPSGRFKVENDGVVKGFTRFGLATLKRRKRRAPIPGQFGGSVGHRVRTSLTL